MAKQEQVAKFLEQGLYHYGIGEIGLALEMWKQVLDLDPSNEVALEYLSIELGSSWSDKISAKSKKSGLERMPVYEPVQPKKSHRAEFALAQQHLKAGKPEPAFSLFSALSEQEPETTAYISFAELSKSALVREFLKKAGSFDRAPVLKISLSKLTTFSLTEEQGFILSLINGETSFEDIVYLSPVPPFTTFSSLKHFLEQGIIEIKAEG